jgi:hypothetical protein
MIFYYTPSSPGGGGERPGREAGKLHPSSVEVPPHISYPIRLHGVVRN